MLGAYISALPPASRESTIEPTDQSVGFLPGGWHVDVHRHLSAAGPQPHRPPDRTRPRPLLRLDHPVLASLTAHLGPAPTYDPCSAIAQPDAFVWEQPQRGFALAAAGHAARIVAAGESRFEDIRTGLKRLLDEAVTLQDSGAALRPAPLAFAGFAFDPAHPDDVAWFGFPEALAIVPRFLVARSGAHLFFTANLMVDANTDPAAALEDLRADAERLLAQLPPDHAAEPTTRLLDPGPDARAYWNDSVAGLTGQIALGAAEKVVLARRVQVEVRRRSSTYRPCSSACDSATATAPSSPCAPAMTPASSAPRRRCWSRSAAATCAPTASPAPPRRGATDDEDAALGAALLADDKERREHAIVARGLRESLASLCRDVRRPEAPGLRRMANVQHLHTPIEATTDGDRHVLELVERLHPTPRPPACRAPPRWA